MPTNVSDNPPLINDEQFLEELDRLEDRDHSAVAQEVHSRATDGDPFEALDSGLPLKTGASDLRAPSHEPARDERVPAMQPYRAAADWPTPAASRVPVMTAVLVIAACLAAGAATAALVFHDRLAQISESRTAIQ